MALRTLHIGAGELIDQGSHLIDLAQWFLGEFTDVQAVLRAFFWKLKSRRMYFSPCRRAEGQTAWLHPTWTE
jgi:predicted dehydrogenase